MRLRYNYDEGREEYHVNAVLSFIVFLIAVWVVAGAGLLVWNAGAAILTP